MFKRTMNLLGVAALALGLVVAPGCSDDDDNPVAPITPPSGQGAMVRVIHASPDAPAVDVYAEGVSAPLIANLGYGQTSDYLEVDPGTYNIQLRASGSPATSTPAFETGDLIIPEGARISALAAGLLASNNSTDKFRVIPLVEDFAAPGAGNAAVRVIHASADAPTVALDVGDDGTPEVTGFARFADTGEAGVALPASTALQIAIWAGSPLSRVTAFTTPPLPEGANLFVIATGLLGKLPRETDGFSLLAVGPGGTIGFIKQNPAVFALHGSPDAPAVDIYAGATELVDNLAFGQLSGQIQVPPGSYDLDFRAHDDGAVAASATTPALAAGERYLAVASGFLGNATFTLIPVVDDLAIGGAGAKLRVVHASPDAPAVDIGTVDGAGNVTALSDFVNLPFKGTSKAGGTSLPATTLDIGVAETGTTPAVATFTITTVPGLRAFAVAAGSLGGTGETFRLLVVNTTAYPWAVAGVLPN